MRKLARVVWYCSRVMALAAAIKRKAECIRTRRALRDLDEHLLLDIGVDPSEIRKPSSEAMRARERLRAKYPGFWMM
jgi:uncharacterized protein YjiS (DUF1127 family)